MTFADSTRRRWGFVACQALAGSIGFICLALGAGIFGPFDLPMTPMPGSIAPGGDFPQIYDGAHLRDAASPPTGAALVEDCDTVETLRSARRKTGTGQAGAMKTMQHGTLCLRCATVGGQVLGSRPAAGYSTLLSLGMLLRL